jgi:hypothetical protein
MSLSPMRETNLYGQRTQPQCVLNLPFEFDFLMFKQTQKRGIQILGNKTQHLYRMI